MHEPIEHDGLEAEIQNRVVEGRDGLLGSMGGDMGDDGHPVLKLGVDLGVEGVEGPAGNLSQLVFPNRRGGKGSARIQDSEIDAEIVEAFVHQARQMAGGTIEAGSGRMTPPRGPCRPSSALLFVGHARPGAKHGLVEIEHFTDSIREVGAADVSHIVMKVLAKYRRGLDQVSVGVDDRMPEVFAQFGCAHFAGPSLHFCEAPRASSRMASSLGSKRAR